MQFYWDSFIEKYGELLDAIPLVKILQAFYYFCSEEADKTDKIIKRKEY